MSSTAAVKKVAKKATPATHPSYKEMVLAAVTALKDRKGSSRQAIAKYIKGNYKVNDSCDLFVKSTLVKGVASGSLVQASGKGASGSFKLPKVEKKAATKPKKAVTKKPVKKVAKKAASPKKAKKTAAKKASPKKAKKTVAKKSVAAKKKPAKKAAVKTVKAKKPAAKKAATKKPAAKKTAQKKK